MRGLIAARRVGEESAHLVKGPVDGSGGKSRLMARHTWLDGSAWLLGAISARLKRVRAK